MNLKEKLTNETDPLSPEAKGRRLKRARNLANLTREELCRDGDINIHTLIGWETGRFGGLSHSGAIRILQRLAQEGVHCSTEWLLNEIGTGPVVITDFSKARQDMQNISFSEPENSSEEKIITNELILFKKLNTHATDFIVTDDGMLPQYAIGDYVAGKKRYKVNIKTTVGLDCIVQTEDGQIFLRNVRKGPSDNTYNLISSNPNTQGSNSILYNVKISSSAPIIWHRKKDMKYY